MYDQTGKLWFKIVSFIVLEAFLFTMSDISWAANYRDQRGSQQMLLDSQKTKDEQNNTAANALSNQLVLTQPAMPYMGFGQVTQQGQGLESVSLIDTTITGLSIAGNDLSDIFKTLKSSGCSVSEAGFGAMRQGFDKKEIYHALMSAGYDKEEVKTLLGSLLKMEAETTKDQEEAEQTKTGPPEEEQAIFEIPSVTELPVEKDAAQVIEKTVREGAVLRQTVEFVRLMINEGKRGIELIKILKKAGLSNERITTALAQLGFNLKDIITILKDANISCADIVQSIYNSQINYSDKDIYTALLKAGFGDEEIIAALRKVGMNAVDILKLTTELGRNMTAGANAMVKAGFNVAEIGQAYVLKAMQWTWDNSIHVINCAVKAFDAFLTNVGRKFSSKQDLAYELIVDDILATGEVQIQNKDVMTSMAAIKNVAQNHGIDLQGYILSLESLMELEGISVVHLDGDHWVTLVGIDGEQVTIIDNGEKTTISLKEFQVRWDGYVLAINQAKIDENKLLTLQMREIRGGRGGILGFVSKVFKGIVEGIKTFVQGVVNIVKGVFNMVIGIVTLDWERIKSGFWQATMGTFQTLCAPVVALYHILPESVARIIGMVMKTIIIAVCTIIGGIIGTILGGNTNAGMAIGAFVGTILGYTWDYDMVMACKNNDVEAFKVVFKKMIIEAVINAAVAFCCAYAGSAISGAGSASGAISSATTAGITSAGAGASFGTVFTNVIASQAMQQLVLNAVVSAIKQTLVTYAINYAMDAAGIDNPYLRAIIVGAAGAWAGSSAGKFTFTETGGWQMGSLMSKEIAKQMAVGTLTTLTMEAVRQQGYEMGWDPLITECAALAVGTFANIGGSSGLGLYKNQQTTGVSFTNLVVANFQASIGGLIGALAAKVVDRLCLEAGMDPLISGVLSGFVESYAGGLANYTLGYQQTFGMADLNKALRSGIGHGLQAGYKDILIRNFGYTESEATAAVYNTSVVWKTVDSFNTVFADRSTINVNDPSFQGKLNSLMETAFKSGLDMMGFNNGFSGQMSSYDQVKYLDEWDQQLDSIEYMTTALDSGIYLDAQGVYRNADGSKNTYMNRNKAKLDYNQYWKEKNPEVFDQQKSSSSTATGNMSFGSAWASAISTRMATFQTEQASSNFSSSLAVLQLNLTMLSVNANSAQTGVVMFTQGTNIILSLNLNLLNNTLTLQDAKLNLAAYGATSTSSNPTALIFADIDEYMGGNAFAYQTTNQSGASEWRRSEEVSLDENTSIKAEVKAATLDDILTCQNLSLVTVQTNSFLNAVSINNFQLNGSVTFDQNTGKFALQNATFSALNGAAAVNFTLGLSNGDTVNFSIENGQGFSSAVIKDKDGSVYQTQIGGIAKELDIGEITSRSSELASEVVSLQMSANGKVTLSDSSINDVNKILQASTTLAAAVIDLPGGAVSANTYLQFVNTANGLEVTALETKTSDFKETMDGKSATIFASSENPVQLIYNRKGEITGVKGTTTGQDSYGKVYTGTLIETAKGAILLANGNSISFANEKNSLLSTISSFFGFGGAGELTIKSGTALAVTNYDPKQNLSYEIANSSGAAGTGGAGGLNRIDIVGNGEIAKGCVFNIKDNKVIFTENDAIYNHGNTAITIAGRKIEVGQKAAVANGKLLFVDESSSKTLKGASTLLDGGLSIIENSTCRATLDGTLFLDKTYTDANENVPTSFFNNQLVLVDATGNSTKLISAQNFLDQKGAITSSNYLNLDGSATTFYRESTMYTDKGLTSAATIRTQITTNSSGYVISDLTRCFDKGNLITGDFYSLQTVYANATGNDMVNVVMQTTLLNGMSTSVGFYDLAGAGTTFFRENTMYADQDMQNALTIRTQTTTSATGDVLNAQTKYYDNGALYKGDLFTQQAVLANASGNETKDVVMRTTVDKGVATSVRFYDLAGAGTTFFRESMMYTDKGLTSAAT
ncbi:MAG: cysteine peptidase family C39 domain-containing protein, partial [Candidatus Omnitrophota bacterium]